MGVYKRKSKGEARKTLPKSYKEVQTGSIYLKDFRDKTLELLQSLKERTEEDSNL